MIRGDPIFKILEIPVLRIADTFNRRAAETLLPESADGADDRGRGRGGDGHERCSRRARGGGRTGARPEGMCFRLQAPYRLRRRAPGPRSGSLPTARPRSPRRSVAAPE